MNELDENEGNCLPSQKIKSLYVKARSPINIALVKYWGKIDDAHIIPANSSLSITIDSNDMCSETQVMLVHEDPDLSKEEKDAGISLILNDKPSKVT